MPGAASLFEHDLATRFHYRREFVAEGDEQTLPGAVADIKLSQFDWHGVAERRRLRCSVTFGTLR